MGINANAEFPNLAKISLNVFKTYIIFTNSGNGI